MVIDNILRALKYFIITVIVATFWGLIIAYLISVFN